MDLIMILKDYQTLIAGIIGTVIIGTVIIVVGFYFTHKQLNYLKKDNVVSEEGNRGKRLEYENISGSITVRSTNAESNRGKRLEYELIRNEILATDRTCVILLGFLLTVTATLVGVSLKQQNPIAAWMISPIWIIGYFYLSEKRFGIIKMAYYIRTKIEYPSIGLGWETWLNNKRNKPKKIFLLRDPYMDPYILETITSFCVVFANLFFVAHFSQLGLRDTSSWSLWIFVILLLVMIIRAYASYNSQCKK